MAWNSSRTGVAIAAFWVIVCVSPSSPAQEWVRWRNTPSLLDQDPAKRLPPQAQAPQARETERAPEPVAESQAVPPRVPRADPSADPIPVAVAPVPAAAVAPSAGSAPLSPTVAGLARTSPAPVAVAVVAPVPTSVAAPKHGAPAITVPAAADAVALEIVPLGVDEAPLASASAGAAPAPATPITSVPALARPEPARAAPRASGAYVTVGSDSDATLVAAAPQVYSCDESGRCEHLESELPSVGLQTAPGVENAPHRQIEPEIKRSALRGF